MNNLMKGLIIIGIICLVLLIIGGVIVSAGNDIVTKRNNVDKTWDDVQSAYQRRLDTIPKFAQVAKFSTEFQINLTLKYAEARSKIANAGASNNATQLQQVADQEMQGLTIMIQQEAVPEAKIDQLTELNAEIDSVERVINHQRDAFNQAVFVYNTAIQTFPNSAIMGMMGWKYESREGFQAQNGADISPPLIL
jgi:LemA protein